MNNTLGDGTKIGTCEHCGDEDIVVYADTNRCDECDSQYTRCLICDEEQHEGSHCRHIFRGTDYEWYGSGAYSPIANEEIKTAFFRLLRLMPSGFAAGLREAILSGKFYTFALMPMIGGGGHIELHGFRDFGFGWECGYVLIRIGQGNAAELTKDGYHWLASLYQDETLNASRITVAWIEQYSAKRTHRQIAD